MTGLAQRAFALMLLISLLLASTGSATLAYACDIMQTVQTHCCCAGKQADAQHGAQITRSCCLVSARASTLPSGAALTPVQTSALAVTWSRVEPAARPVLTAFVSLAQVQRNARASVVRTRAGPSLHIQNCRFLI
jgi:hypothetical protein